MAINPIIYNEGGVYRFEDYLSQIPNFLKNENDVVTLLQLFSDYLNNAYRNIDTVKKYEFKLISVESRLGTTINKLKKLETIFKKSEEKGLNVLYLSKPISSPVTSNDFFLGMFKYSGSLENLSPSIINVPLTGKDGHRAYIEFTDDDQFSNSGVYVYNETNNTLTLDPFGSSQDPFTETQNKPIPTVAGLLPRMIEFSPKNISKVLSRKSKIVGTTIFYEVFFTAEINNIKSIPSSTSIDVDVNKDKTVDYTYLIDYYNAVDTIPSSYRYKYSIEFPSGCVNIDWDDSNKLGRGIFYARELTQFGEGAILDKNRINKYSDPLYNEKTKKLDIINISVSGTTVTIKTKFPHSLSKGQDFNIEDTTSYNEKNLVVSEIIDLVTFKYETSISPSGTETSGTAIITNLYFSKPTDHPTKSFLKVPYKNLEGTTEFSAGNTIARITEREEVVSSNFNAEDINLNFSEIGLISNPFAFLFEDKVTIRRNSDHTGTFTIPTGLTEGALYEVAYTAPGNVVNVKLNDVNITSAGTGIFELIKLSVYFNSNSDVDISKNEITLHHAKESSSTNPIDPLQGLNIGDSIKFRGERTGIITLPTPLSENITYEILTIDKTTKTITLTTDGENEIDITAIGTGIIEFVKLDKSPKDVATIKSVSIDVSGSSGTLTLENHIGNFISIGSIAKIKNGKIDFRADINSATKIWSDDISDQFNLPTYKKGSTVYYNGVKYKLANNVVINNNNNVKTPDVDSQNYIRNMEDITIRDFILTDNPYMFGTYRVKHLEFEEEPNFNSKYDDLSLDLYIEEVEDLELKIGHDQREWIFNPRLAPKNFLNRNGFIEIIQSSQNIDAVKGDVSEFTKASSAYGMLLEGLSLDITRTITSLTYSSETNLITAICSSNHRLKNNVRVTISGATESEYNGIFSITVIDATTFTYTPETEPTITTATGSPIFNFENTIDHDVISITRSGTVATVTTNEIHGFKTGNSIIISGSTPSGYNGTHEITVTANNQFTYIVSSGLTTPATGTIKAQYQPVNGDFIEIKDQSILTDNGIYIAKIDDWEKYDDTKLSSNSILYMKQNIFDVTENNPKIAKGPKITVGSISRSGNVATVTLQNKHDYIIGTIVNISNAQQSEYNGKFEVATVPTNQTFTYLLKTSDSPSTPAIPIKDKSIISQSDRWYKYTVNSIGWQQKSNLTSASFKVGSSNTEYTINPKGSSIHENNISLLSGEFKFTYQTTSGDQELKFVGGDIVNLNDQFISSENGKYRVKKGEWKRLDKRLVMKINDISIDYIQLENPDIIDTKDPVLYKTHNDTDSDTFITENFNGNLNIYKVDNLFSTNFDFLVESVKNIDTTKPFHKNYDSKFDKNTATDRTNMDISFKGIPDMKYPLIEKIERLAYLKDPNVIDFDFIFYLAKFMGYDITPVIEDITESVFYKNKEAREMAVRKVIQNLPQYYSLKSTKSGLELLMLVFGIVGKVVTLWTDSNSPYDEFVPDYLVRNTQYDRMLNNTNVDMVPTPHFKLDINVEGNFENQLNSREVLRLIKNVEKFKPINTVFNGINTYMQETLGATIYIGNMKAKGRLQADIGFNDIEFDYGSVLGNDCL